MRSVAVVNRVRRVSVRQLRCGVGRGFAASSSSSLSSSLSAVVCSLLGSKLSLRETQEGQGRAKEKGRSVAVHATMPRAAAGGGGKKKEETAGGKREAESSPEKKTKKARAAPTVPLVPDPAERKVKPGDADAKTLKVMSWNVAGLRSFFNAKSDTSEGKRAMLRRLWQEERPDVLFLAEHKLQKTHIEDTEKSLKEVLGVGEDFRGEIHWNVSSEKKGYSGVVCILRHARQSSGGNTKKQASISSYFGAGASPDAKAKATGGGNNVSSSGDDGGSPAFKLLDVTFGLGEDNSQAREYNNEGRVVTAEFDSLFVVSAYVPNSGEGLKRLDYRLGTWEKDMNAHLTKLDKIKPVIYIGDMNVAHLVRCIPSLRYRYRARTHAYVRMYMCVCVVYVQSPPLSTRRISDNAAQGSPDDRHGSLSLSVRSLSLSLSDLVSPTSDSHPYTHTGH